MPPIAVIQVWRTPSKTGKIPKDESCDRITVERLTMELLFRRLRGGVAPAPEPGEIHIRTQAAGQTDRRDFASLLMEQGTGVFPSGAGPIRRIVVDADPTLDDVLAAALTVRLLAGEALPDGCRAFARYAALVREGLKPSDIPLEVSLEGIFLALRSAGGDLTDADSGARFADNSARLTDAILQAAEAGVDPFTTPLFATGADFARERAFLTRDREVYRQDVLRGERWSVQIPGGPPQATALVLREPKSLLFKYWSRRDDGPAGGQAFLLLAVRASAGQWVFSTDPIQRLSLKPLADLLQSAEAAQDARCAQGDPWFDGKPFGHTLVAAPRGGTVLSDKTVLSILRRWSGARTIGRAGPLRWAGLFGAAAAVMLIVAGLASRYIWGQRPVVASDQEQQRSVDLEDVQPRQPDHAATKGNLYLLTVGVSKYKNPKYHLGVARADAEKLSATFRQHSGSLFERAIPKVLTDEQATRDAIIEELAKLKKANQYDLVVVTLSGHGAHLDENEDFYFLPYDFDDASAGRKAATGVFWDDFKRHLGKLPCHVFLVLDTCHSGTVTRQLRSPDEQKTALQKGVYQLQKSRSGMVVMAACMGSGTAQEKNEWGHGALTLALLEGLSGTHRYRGRTATALPTGDAAHRINLKELDHYVTNRVQELAGDHQAVVTNQTGDIAMQRIFIAMAGGGQRK